MTVPNTTNPALQRILSAQFAARNQGKTQVNPVPPRAINEPRTTPQAIPKVPVAKYNLGDLLASARVGAQKDGGTQHDRQERSEEVQVRGIREPSTRAGVDYNGLNVFGNGSSRADESSARSVLDGSDLARISNELALAELERDRESLAGLRNENYSEHLHGDSAYAYDSRIEALTDDELLEELYGPSDEDIYIDSIQPEEDRFEVADILAGVSIDLDDSQADAVRGLAVEQYGCLIGAAGTGKTTTTRYLLNTLINGDAAYGIEAIKLERVDLIRYHDHSEDKDDSDEDEYDEKRPAPVVVPAIAMVAFTGQATQVLRKNMPHGWKKNVMTIHSLLGFAPVEFTREDGSAGMRFEPSYTKLNKMPWDVILVDEASMVNLDLWHMLLDAAKMSCRFYFVGDLNQLTPPVGLGILGFALAKWPTFELTTVHRSADDAQNRIVDTAWRVLQGKSPEFDSPETNQNWRVIGIQLPHSSHEAHTLVIGLAKGLSTKKLADGSPVYDPWRDRIMTQMNGFNEDDPASLMGQYPLNESLSKIFADPDQPRVIIDAKKTTKKFSVGYRVMATKNEPPNAVDRVTNGATGRIIAIEPNSKWTGDRRLVGIEHEVAENRKAMLKEAMEHKSPLQMAEETSHALDSLVTGHISSDNGQGDDERQGGPSSHIVTVKYDAGATRTYSMNAGVEQLQIAYASTTHKAQGAEMPTAIIVVHHANKRMLTRENLYTAVTRASQRVIILYTEYGMRIALATQRITGSTLKDKIKQYQRLLGDEVGGFKTVNVRLTFRD